MCHRTCIFMLAGVGFCIGCGGEEGLEGLVAVTGTVTYQSKPVEGAQVAFSPDKTGSRLAYECLWGTAAATDVLVWRKSDFEDRLHLKASLPATVVREGRLLYAA